MTPPMKWQDWASFALALWLALSPWFIGYSHHEAATANAAFVGIALALISHYEVSLNAPFAEWLNLFAGLWLVCAPFVLGFSPVAVAAVAGVAVGSAIVVLAASVLSLDKEIEKWWHEHIASQ